MEILVDVRQFEEGCWGRIAGVPLAACLPVPIGLTANTGGTGRSRLNRVGHLSTIVA